MEERGWAYRGRQPEGTVLYEAVKDNLATLLEEASEVTALGHPPPLHAAEKRDNKALAESYGRLMETCVACHAAYLHRQ